MNIAILIPGFSDGERDWCIPVYLNLVRRLAERDQVHVFALRYPPRRDHYKVYGANVHTIGGRYDTSGAARLRLWLRTLAAIRAVHQRAPFDVIHAIWADETGLIANIAGRLLRVPTVVSLAGGELIGLPDIGYGLQNSRLSRWIVARALHDAGRVIAPCGYAAALVRRHLSAERLVIIPLGVDTDLFAAADSPSPNLIRETRDWVKAPHLLSVGSLTTIKDHASLLRAFARLRTPGVTLEIVGEGPLEPALRAQAESLGIANRVHIRGMVAHDDLPALYRAADLHVLTSRHEAFGMVVVEAAACGVPTVGYAHGILPDLAALNAGVAILPGDTGALADAINSLLADPDRLIEMGAAARQCVRERYTLDAMVEGIRGVYRLVTS